MTVALHRGEVIGVTTITRKRFWDGQQEVPAAEIGDTYSSPLYRRQSRAEQPYIREGKADEYLSRSIFGRLVAETRQRALDSGLTLIYGTPNNNSMPGYVNRLGFFDYQSHFNRYYVRPGVSAASKRLAIMRPLARAVYPLDRAYAWMTAKICGRSAGFRAEELSAPGDMADALWARLQGQMPMGAVRDGAYFRHRFLTNPLAKYRFWAVHTGGEPCGVFVSRAITHEDNLRSVHLAEWLIDPSVRGAFRFMAAHMVATIGDFATKSYSFWAEHGWASQQGLKPLGFLARGRVPIIFHGAEQSRNLDSSGVKFHFTLASSDNI